MPVLPNAASAHACQCPTKCVRATAPQHDLASLCTALENSGREALMTVLAGAHIGASNKHPRPRMALAAYLMKEGCGLVNTQPLGRAGTSSLGHLPSWVPKVILRSGAATKVALGVVVAFVAGSLLLACGMCVVYVSYRFDLCQDGLDWLLSSCGCFPRRGKGRRNGTRAPLRRGKGKVGASDEKEMSLSVPGPPPFGIEVLRNNTIVAREGKAAHALLVGDRIISVDGNELTSRTTVQTAVDKRLRKHTFVVMRPLTKRGPASTTSQSEATDDDDDDDF